MSGESPVPNFPLERQRALARRNYAALSLIVLIPPAIWLWDAKTRGGPYDPGRSATYTLSDASGGRSGTLSFRAEGTPGGAAVEIMEQTFGDGDPVTETRFSVNPGDGARADAPNEKLVFFLPSNVGALAGFGFSRDERLESGELAARVSAVGTGTGEAALWAPGAPSPETVWRTPRHGPRLALVRWARDERGAVVGKAVHDAGTGLLLHLETRGAEGVRAADLWATNVPLQRAGALTFAGLAMYLTAWAAFHLGTMRRAGLLDRIDGRAAARLLIRLLAFPFSDLATAFALPVTGLCFLFPVAERAMLAADALGFLLLLYAIGPYALLVLPKFVGYLPGAGYPFYVPFFGFAVLVYMLVKYARRPTRSVLWPL